MLHFIHMVLFVFPVTVQDCRRNAIIGVQGTKTSQAPTKKNASMLGDFLKNGMGNFHFPQITGNQPLVKKMTSAKQMWNAPTASRQVAKETCTNGEKIVQGAKQVVKQAVKQIVKQAVKQAVKQVVKQAGRKTPPTERQQNLAS